ncbi:MAG: histidine phosphatase family protein [Candidatus Obscuribacterales bacterium]|nr:histidine phosphatase family protein [Candidatus Obscuribacterales bacterium]
MTLNLYLLRHGETEFSQSGGFCGFTDAALTAEGKLMASQFADAYSHLHWQDIYCSPLQRTVDTATPIAARAAIEIKKREGLKEINYGKWEGLTHDFVKAEYAEDYNKWLAEPAWNSPSGGETAFQIAERALNVVSEIRSKFIEGNVLLVSHKATIRIILCSLLGIDLGRYRERLNALTGSCSLVKIGAHGPLLELLNDRSHLSADLRSRPGT